MKERNSYHSFYFCHHICRTNTPGYMFFSSLSLHSLITFLCLCVCVIPHHNSPHHNTPPMFVQLHALVVPLTDAKRRQVSLGKCLIYIVCLWPKCPLVWSPWIPHTEYGMLCVEQIPLWNFYRMSKVASVSTHFEHIQGLSPHSRQTHNIFIVIKWPE